MQCIFCISKAYLFLRPHDYFHFGINNFDNLQMQIQTKEFGIGIFFKDCIGRFFFGVLQKVFHTL